MRSPLARALFVLALFSAAPVWGDDFVVESKIFVGKDDTSAAQSITIFRSGVVYDFLTDPSEITVFDPPRKRFIVLDTKRRVKTELNTDEVEAFNLRLKHEAQTRNVALLSFLAEPSFDESFDRKSGDLKMTSDWMSYRVKSMRPRLPMAGSQYIEYGDWQVKLNTVLRPGPLPPFPRLMLNAALDKHGRVPTEVELTRYGSHPVRRQVTIRAEHRWQWRLLESDLKRLEEADTHLVTFSSVSLSEYLRPGPPATGGTASRSTDDSGSAALQPSGTNE